MPPDAGQRFQRENTDRAVKELQALGLGAIWYARVGFPDIVELPSSISSDLTEKVEEIMKRHGLVRLQEAEFRVLRRHDPAEQLADNAWTSMWKSGSEDVPLAGRLMGAFARIPAAEYQLSLLRTEIFEAEMAAAAAKRPTADLRALGDEIDTLKEMLHEKIEVVVQRLALEEAGSSG
jgi:hypothetical protein